MPDDPAFMINEQRLAQLICPTFCYHAFLKAISFYKQLLVTFLAFDIVLLLDIDDGALYGRIALMIQHQKGLHLFINRTLTTTSGNILLSSRSR